MIQAVAYIRRILYTLSLLLLVYSVHWGQCTLEGPFEINDFDVIQLELDISGLVNNDLSDPQQGICAVAIEFKHERVGNLLIEMQSPSGQLITLVGPNGPFGLTSFTNWDVSFVPCGSVANPDGSFDPFWTNQNAWGNFGNYNGSYYPFSGCLEDFNAGPANGIWTFIIRDAYLFDEGEIESISIFFCDPSGLDCAICSAPEVFFEQDEIQLCEIDYPYDTIGYSLGPAFDHQTQDFQFLISRADSIEQVIDTNTIPDLPPGSYDLCALSFEKSDSSAIRSIFQIGQDLSQAVDSATLEGLCFELSSSCQDVHIDEYVDTLMKDTSFCGQQGVVIMGDTIMNPGTYHFVDSSEACPQYLLYNVDQIELIARINGLDSLDCTSASQLVDASSSSYGLNTQFLWYHEDSLIAFDTSRIMVGDTGNYRLVLREGQCGDTLDFSVNTSFEGLYFNLPTFDTLTCLIDSVTIFPDSTNAASWFWILSNGDTLFSDTIIVQEAGRIKFQAVGVGDCLLIDSIEVHEDKTIPPVFIDTMVNLCGSDSIPLRVVNSDTSTTYQWTGPGGFLANVADTFGRINGRYVLQATQQYNGCTSRDTFEFNLRPPLDTPEINSDTLSCEQLLIQIRLDSIYDEYEYSWISPSGDTLFNPEPSVDESGRFILRIYRDNRCFVDLKHTVERSVNLPEVTISGDSLDCSGDAVALIAVSSIMDSSYEYHWTGPEGESYEGDTIYTNYPGTYILHSGRDSICQQIDTFFLEETTLPPNISLLGDTLNCRDTVIQISIMGPDSLAYIWTRPDNSMDSGSLIFTTLPGLHKVQIINDSCRYNRAVFVEIDTVSPSPAFNIVPVTCDNDTAFIDFIGPSSIDMFVFDPDSAEFLSSEDNIFKTSVPGDYKVRLIDNNHCITDTNINIIADTVAPYLSVLFADTLDCENDSIWAVLGSTIPFRSIQWKQSNNEVMQADSFLIREFSDISLEVTFENGCSRDSMLTPPIDTTSPDVILEITDLDCNLSEVILEPEFDQEVKTVIWTNGAGDTIIKEPNVRIINPGNYFLHAVGQNGCRLDTQFYVGIDTTLPDISIIGDTLACHETETQLQVLTDTSLIEQYSWRLESGDRINERSISAPVGKHTLFITGINGCIDSFDYEVLREDYRATVSNIKDTLILDCNDRERRIQPQLGMGVDSFYWIDNEGMVLSQKDITVRSAGTYFFVALNREGCSDRIALEVLVDTAKAGLSISGDTLNCRQAADELEVTTSAVNPSYKWEGPGGFMDTVAQPVVVDTGWYYLTVTDARGCQVSDSVRIFGDFEKPTYILPDTVFRNCKTLLAQASVGVDSTVNVAWYQNNQLLSQSDTFLTDATGRVTIVLEAENGCRSIDSLLIDTVGSKPFAIWNSTTLDCNDPIDTLSLERADGAYTYSWSGPSGFTSNVASPIVDTGGWYTVTYTNELNCSNTDSLLVIQQSLPIRSSIVITDSIRCEDSTTLIMARLNRTLSDTLIRWRAMNGDIISGDRTLTPIVRGPGTFILEVEDAGDGCTLIDTVHLELSARPPLDFQVLTKDILCEGDEGGIISWTTGNEERAPYRSSIDGQTFQDSSFFPGLRPGMYILSIQDRQSCIYSDTVEIREILGEISLDLGPDLEATGGEEIKITFAFPLDEIFIDTFYWEVNGSMLCGACDTLRISADGPKRVRIFLYTKGGCMFSDELIIEVPTEQVFYVPNIFTPNGDGNNDFFFVQTALDIEQIDHLQIYDRWGNIVYEVKNFPPNEIEYGWDGTFEGLPLFPQVLAVRIVYTFDGARRIEHFDLMLVR